MRSQIMVLDVLQSEFLPIGWFYHFNSTKILIPLKRLYSIDYGDKGLISLTGTYTIMGTL